MFAQDNLLSAADAALQLDLDPSRVRAMAHSGQLVAKKIGGRWLIDQSSVEHRRESEVVDGRPFSAPNAWALLCLAEGESVDWVSRSALSRLRSALRNRGLHGLAPRLRSRAQPMYLRAHPAALDRMASEPDVVRAGVSAASGVGIDVLPSEELDVYLPSGRVEDVVSKYGLEASDRPNVVLRVIADVDPFPWQDCVGPAVVAIDLFESHDPRSRRAAQQFLDRFVFEE